MRRRWMLVLVAGLTGVLVCAASARAECGWVLWGQAVDPWNALAAFPLGAWTSRAECEQERLKREQTPAEQRMATYLCLPDTIDPRAPKGRT
jgi:hypothetical protein